MRRDAVDDASPVELRSFIADDSADTAEMGADSVPTERAHRRADSPRRPDDGVPALGERVGRYVALRVLGRGGMGVVIAAHDPELDRQVAIKLVHPNLWRAASDEARAQLRQEARAMARLVHPNVVAVHDLGTVDDQVFVAMELVAGTSLDLWLAQRPRPWREVLAVCRDAGRGLAAAHRAGLVHRDVKPHNVLVGDDGRPRIADFGLAALTGGATEMTPGGTPAYMSPEQHARTTTGPASDQFNYCVMVYEALYGERPFAGKTAAAIAEEVTRGRIRPAPARSKVPSAVRRALLRGLSPDPSQRFPTQDLLLAELEPRPMGRWIALATAVTLAAGAGAAVMAFAGHDDPERDARRAAAIRAGEVWSAATRRAMTAAIAADAAGHAPATAERVAASLDRYLDGWIDARVVLARRGRAGDEPPLASARRHACLDRRLGQVDALVHALTAAGPGVATAAVDATAALPPVAGCVEGDAVLAIQAPPEERARRARHDQLVRRLDEITALDEVGRTRDAAAAATELVVAARALDHPPLTAQAIHLEAITLMDTGAADRAIEGLRASIAAAANAHDDALAARAWVDLVGLTFTAGRGQPGDDLVLAARAAVARVGDPPPLAIALENATALVALAAGRAADAEAGHRRALARAEAELPPDHRLRADLRLNIAAAMEPQHRYADSLAMLEHARRAAEVVWGPAHPSLSLYWSNLASMHYQLGDLAASRVAAERSAALAEPGTRADGVAKMRVAAVHGAADRPAQAIELLRAAAALFERNGNRRQQYEALHTLAITQYNSDDPEAAATIERALALIPEVFPSSPEQAVLPLSLAGMIAGEADDHKTAAARCQRALELGLAHWGKDDPELFTSALCVARSQRLLGTPSVAAAEEAVRIASHSPVDHYKAEAQVELARTAWDARARRRARAELAAAMRSPAMAAERKADLTKLLRTWGGPP